MKPLIKTAILGSVITLSGCQTGMQAGALVGVPQDSASLTTQKQYAPTKPSSIHVYLNGEKVNKKYKVIGSVSVDQNKYFIPRSEEEKIRILKKKAASIGGDAVIEVSNGMMAETGTVIKYT